MTFFPYLSLFLMTLIMGSLMSLSANHWFYVWLGLELNLLSFIPLMNMSKTNQESEAAGKYFLAQALGSAIMLLGAINMYLTPQIMISPSLFSQLIIIGLLIKLGLPPYHFWFPLVMNNLSWPMCFVLLTWQKIAPLLIMFWSITNPYNLMLMLIIFMSSIIGGIGGMNQSQIRPLLAYSSIGHMSWMLAGSIYSNLSSYLYLLIYMLITTAIIILMLNINKSIISMMDSIKFNNPIFMLSVIALLLSLGGIPPFLGFLPKWLIIQSLSNYSNMFLLMILIIGSIMNLFYYLNMIFMSLLNLNKPTIIATPTHKNKISSTFLALVLLGVAPISIMLL
uniref:NADH-ubiquinone oxidoreductase chain 2 n=1 Tax=Laetmonice producta TaxID=2153329 RepID=A0A343W6E2_9ANNE|nr:NADH dehydrogenase subunit 2 [Laetmonice producta]